VTSGTLAAAHVDLNFESDEYYQLGGGTTLAALVTVSRASAGYADNLAGVWTSFAVNTARRTDKGLLVEEARTNGVRNNSMTGVVAGSPGTLPTNWVQSGPTGLTRTISTGTTDGIDWIQFAFTGTTTGAGQINITCDTSTGIIAGVGEVWTGSAWISNAANTGVTSLFLRNIYNTAAGGFVNVTNSAQLVGSTTFTRRTVTGTTVATTGRINLGVVTNNILASTAVNFTVRIGWPQLELGAFATSPIRTTTVAVTRAADAVSLTTVPTFAAVYSLLAAAKPAAPVTYAGHQSLLTLSNPAGSHLTSRSSVFRALTTGRPTIEVNNTDVAVAAVAWAQDISGSVAAAFEAGNQALSFNGAAAVPAAAALTPAAALTTVSIGSSPLTVFWNGYLERVIIWPNVRLPNGELERLTT